MTLEEMEVGRRVSGDLADEDRKPFTVIRERADEALVRAEIREMRRRRAQEAA